MNSYRRRWRFELEELFWCSFCYIASRECGDTRRSALCMSLNCRAWRWLRYLRELVSA